MANKAGALNFITLIMILVEKSLFGIKSTFHECHFEHEFPRLAMPISKT